LLIPISKNSSLPPELPENLIYWNRCETKVKADSQSISNSELEEFYKFQLHHFPQIGKDIDDDLLAYIPTFQDQGREEFISKAEEKIFKSVKKDKNQGENRKIEGFI